MAKTQKAVHVAVVKSKYKDRTYETVLLRHTYREDGKVKNETLANLTSLPPDAIEVLRAALKGETLVSLAHSFEIVTSRPHGHVRAVLEAMDRLGMASLIASAPGRQRSIILGLIAARILAPNTKLATTRWWQTSTLAAELGLQDVTDDEVYAAMDWLASRQERIEDKLARRHLADGATALYDLSSSYLTGEACDFARRGYSRDGKKGTLQVNYGLLTDQVGRPVAVTMYPGNTADSLTFGDQVELLRDRFKLQDVVLVGDRGMITQAHLETLKKDGFNWVTALKSGAIRKLVGSGAIQLGLFDERNLASITHPDYPGEQLVACRNPALAERRRHVRENLIEATRAVLASIKARVEAGKLEGEDAIGLAVGRVVDRYKVAKHFSLTISARAFEYRVNEDSVREEAALDGLYVIRTSLASDRLTPAEAVRTYKLLGQVERAFRCLKTVNLKVRPIHHRLVDRVATHLFLCVLAYYVEWHLREAWTSLTFADEDALPPLEREPVLPATRSPSARRKTTALETTDGLPVHSFRTLLDTLATLTRNTCRRPGGTATFSLDSLPDEVQAKAFRLVGTLPTVS
jgi:hypothetical protein